MPYFKWLSLYFMAEQGEAAGTLRPQWNIFPVPESLPGNGCFVYKGLSEASEATEEVMHQGFEDERERGGVTTPTND